jgi:hypothetical protein
LKFESPTKTWLFISCSAGKQLHSFASAFWVYSSDLQLRSSFIPGQDSCLTINFPGSKIGFIATLTTDFVLLIIMLVGLIRLRLRGYGMMSLGRTLWKQVGQRCFLQYVVRLIR